ncbi:dihydropteroate synthase [Peptostreptococcus faecalis]|uniref:dihydropteroate synthase n=1 Tax=Peptostreptococcus faecalis TaxID=2045015 RepID=UPI000C79D2D1|nr:dihydropteroate synthase [Peptostreptococcus faecalis]
MIIGNKKFDTKNNVYIMGILNITPDSFSDGGKYDTLDQALFRAEKMIKDGASIIDIGGESTRPGHIQISDDEEINRVMPVLEKLKSNFDIPLSLDTYKSNVVLAVKDKIDLVNDIWGLKYDPKMASAIAKIGLPCCIMHNRNDSNYTNFWEEFISDINESINLARAAGIKDENIMIDGGVGFAKSYEQNLSVMNRTDELCNLGFPVLVATSKKRVIGTSTDKTVDQRTIGTVATTVVGVMKGASFIRVHDIDENWDAIKMTKCIMEEKKWIP